MRFARVREIAVERVANERRHLCRNFIRNDGDHADSAKRGERERDGVVAGKHGEITGNELEELAHLRNVAGCFLDTDDIVDLREARDGSRLEVDAGAARNVVKNHGDADRGSDGLEVLVKTFLRGFVVIRRDGKDAVRAERFVLPRGLDHFGGVVSSGTGDDGRAATGFFECDLDDASLLGMR